jgi:hypothetical protein
MALEERQWSIAWIGRWNPASGLLIGRKKSRNLGTAATHGDEVRDDQTIAQGRYIIRDQYASGLNPQT